MKSFNITVKLDGYFGSGDPAYTIDGYTSSTSFYSAPIPVMRKYGYSLTFTCPSTGSPLGHVYLQGCNDEGKKNETPDETVENWVNITGLDNALSGESTLVFEDRRPMYRWLRVHYARTSGDITATIRIHTRELI